MLLLLIETIFSLHSCRRRAQLQDKAINLLNGWHKANNFQSTFTHTYAHTRTHALSYYAATALSRLAKIDAAPSGDMTMKAGDEDEADV